MDLTVEVVREWLAANKAQDGVKKLLVELSTAPILTAETVGAWLRTDDGKAFVEPIIDRERTRAVKTHDEKTKDDREAAVKKAVEEAVAKANPKETPLEKELRDMKAEFAKEKQAREMRERELARNDLARKKGVDAYLPGDYLPSNIEAFEKEADRISAAIEARVVKDVNERLAGSYRPGSGNGTAGKKVDVTKLSLADAIKLEEAGELNKHLSQ